MPGFRALRAAAIAPMVCATVLLLLAIAPSARAATYLSGLSIVPANPVAGDPITAEGAGRGRVL